MVKIGRVQIRGWSRPLPRSRERAKGVFRDIAKDCKVAGLHFVHTTRRSYKGKYKPWSERIIVVEQRKSRQVPIYAMAFYFLHELVHHLQHREFLFAPVYYREARSKSGRWVKIPLADARRLAVRAEKHADRKAVELAYELFGLELAIPPYSEEALQKMRNNFDQ